MKEASNTGRPRLERVREAVGQLRRVITSLLAHFRSQGELALQEVDLAQLLAHFPVESLTVHVRQGCRLRADPNLLAAVLVNLLDNAQRYGARTCWVECRREGPNQYIRVKDDGPGVSPARCRVLQETVDQPSDDEFVGLGLKLAARVARAHKGRLVIDGWGADERGFSVTLVLWSDQHANTTP
jgi:signal transduction histidine kinase